MDTPTPTSALVIRSFIVKANQGWQDSGIRLYAGDTVEITYIAGQWRTGVDWAYTDANGSDGEESKMREAAQKEKGDPDYYKILREGAYQSLISKIGDGTPKLVGNNTTTVAEVPGTLYLRVNDIDESLKDNDGTITVQITSRHH